MSQKKYDFKPGDIFKSWEILYELPKVPKKHKYLHCKCLECGKEYDVDIYNLVNSKSGMCKACNNRKTWTKHGLSNHPLYTVFKDMHNRCENPKNHRYADYGGRGIVVCDEWEDTEEGIINFVEWSESNGYKEGLQLDRHDNDLGYSPCNCRYITPSANNFNRRSDHPTGYRFTNYNKYETYITKDNKWIALGYYETENDAQQARMIAELFLYGELSPWYRENWGDTAWLQELQNAIHTKQI